MDAAKQCGCGSGCKKMCGKTVGNIIVGKEEKGVCGSGYVDMPEPVLLEQCNHEPAFALGRPPCSLAGVHMRVGAWGAWNSYTQAIEHYI